MKGGSNMRVYAPRRVCVAGDTQYYQKDVGYSRHAYGLPLDGDWIDIPDYFRQVSSGLPVNDVVHAKLVDEYEIPFSMLDHWVLIPYRCELRQVDLGLMSASPTVSGCMSYCAYHVEQRTVDLAPSSNYKGKKKASRRVERYVRVENPIAARFSCSGTASSVWSNPLQRNVYYKHASISLLEVSVPLDPDNAQAGSSGDQQTYTYRSAQIRFVLSFDDTGLHCRLQDYDEFAFCEAICVFIESMVEGPSIKRWSRDQYDEVATTCATFVANFVRQHAREFAIACALAESHGNPRVKQHTGMPTIAYSEELPDIDFKKAFLLKEPEIYADHLDPLMLGKDLHYTNYWRNYLIQHAILEACESLPRLSDNSISNLIEVVGFIKALVVDHRIEMPKSLADAWLAYRYQYSTGKQDIQDAIKFVRRHMDLGTLDRQIVGRGISHHTIEGVDVTCRCSISVTPKDVSYVHKLIRSLDQYGLTPDFYVIWDSIPYSFMVDWFLPISDLASVSDANAMYFSGEFYTLDDLCLSLEYTREVDGFNVHCYTRWLGSIPSSLNGMYWLDAPSASSKTVGKRILDAASIFIGR
jgi:hypothetical protein